MSFVKERITTYQNQLFQDSTARPDLFNCSYSIDAAQNQREYMDSIEKWNADRIMILMMVIHHHLQKFDVDSYSLLLVGSDGRRENAPHSEFELCVVTDNANLAEAVRQTILDHSCSNTQAFSEYPSHRIPTSDRIIEIKNIKEAEMNLNYVLSGFNGNPEYVWPDRILHAQLLWGNPDLFSMSKKKVLEELSTSPKLLSRLHRQGKQFEQTTVTGISKRQGSSQKHFSVEDGEIYFSPEKYILGLKYSVIRLVQNILLTSQIHSQEITNDGNTLQLLGELFSHLNSLYDDVQHSYSSALHLYHQQQKLYYDSPSPSQATIRIPSTELIEILQPVIYLYDEVVKSRR